MLFQNELIYFYNQFFRPINAWRPMKGVHELTHQTVPRVYYGGRKRVHFVECLRK